MEIREIEAFLVLAEELHFGRTAERLYVSPARVSQLIQALERRVGARVVERTSRAVRLTPVGEQLLRDAGPAYQGLGRAVTGAQIAARQQGGVLRLGVWQTIRSTLPSDLGAAFEADHPGCQEQVTIQSPVDLYEPLRSGEVDALLIRLPAAPEAMPAEPGIAVGPVFATEDRAVVMADDHPLASRAEVSLEDLADHEVLGIPDAFPGYFQDLWVPPVTPSGRLILRTKGWSSGHLDDVWNLVARGHLVYPTIANILDLFPRPGLTTVPLTGLPPCHTVLARRATHAALVDAFVATAAAFAADSPRRDLPLPAPHAKLNLARPDEVRNERAPGSGPGLRPLVQLRARAARP